MSDRKASSFTEVPVLPGTCYFPFVVPGDTDNYRISKANLFAELSGGATFANPTALVGLSPVNGNGTDAMRANAAPALNVTISPEWSGKHIYNNGIFFGNAALSAIWGPLGARDIFTAFGTDTGPASDRRWEMSQATDAAFTAYGDISATVNSGAAFTSHSAKVSGAIYTQTAQSGDGGSSKGYTEYSMILSGQYRYLADPAGRQALSTGYRFDVVAPASRINTLTRVAEFRNNGVDQFVVDINGNIVNGVQSVLSTSATDGFIYVPVTNGTPTANPTTYAGKVPITLDSSGTKLWAFIGGGWKSSTLA